MATTRPARVCARFDCFELDLNSGELRKNDGTAFRIQPKPLQILRVLMESQGKVVTREQLRSVLWPEQTFVDFEHGINTAVRKLRQALNDSVENPRFVETLPKIGYRFLATVEWISNGNEAVGANPSASPEGLNLSGTRTQSRYWRAAGAVAVLAIAVGVSVAFSGRPGKLLSRIGIGRRPLRQVVSERRLTANPDDTPVTSGVISPDGKYLAYSDATGFYLREVDGGESHPVPLPKGFDALAESWFPDNTHLLVSHVEVPVEPPGLWVVSVMGGTPRKIVNDAFSAAVSPDGLQIAFSRQNGIGQEIWVMQAQGDNARRLIISNQDHLSRVAWAPDNKRFAYATTKTRYYTSRNGPDSEVKVFDMRSERTTVIRDLGDRGLPRGGAALGWTPENDLIYAMREPRPNQLDTNIWRQRLDPETAQVRGEPERLTNDRNIAVQLSMSRDGNRLALRRHAPQPDIFIADIEFQKRALGPLRRLTLDDRQDYAMAWTPDSRCVISYSNRDGPFHVFKQNIEATQAERLVGGPDDLYAPRITPDGANVVYIVRAKAGAISDNSKVMRVSLEGGPSRLVFEEPSLWDIECSRLPSTLCLASTIQAGHQSFFAFDPVKGKERELWIPESGADNFDWSLAPNGQYIAWAKNRGSQKDFGIRVLSLLDGSKRDIPVPGWVEIFGLDWSADSQGFWATAYNTKGVRALLHVALEGRITSMLVTQGADLAWAIPSPDGRRLAIVKDTNSSNVSLLEKF